MQKETDTKYFKNHAGKLLEKGYSVIPIRENSKAPALSAWQNIEANAHLVEQWAKTPQQGVGVKTGELSAVDVDVMNPALLDALVNHCLLNYGFAPVRVGNAPKTLIVYRSSDPLRRKRESRKFIGPKGDGAKVEILGKGQQFVAYGTNPDSKAPYTWTYDLLEAWDIGDIPVLGDDELDDIIKKFELEVQNLGYVGKKRPSSTTTDFDALASIMPPTDLSDDHVILILKRLPADGYEDWREVGMALHHQYEGGEKGFALWDKWSQQSDKYNADEMRSKWSSFDGVREGLVVTFRTLIEKSGVKSLGTDPLADTLQHFVYIADGDCVADLRQLPHNGLFKLSEFKNYLANVRLDVPVTTVGGKKTTKKTSVAQLWMVNPLRKSTTKRSYSPGREQLYQTEGCLHYNSFAFPNHKPTTDVSLLHLFFDHLEYLFIRPVERQWFIGWLAHIVQFPESRPPLVPLHISRLHGTGRGILTKVIRRLIGMWNCTKTKAADLVEGKYNDFLNDSLCCFIDEAKSESSKRYEVSDKMRDTLSEDMLEVNSKYGKKKTQLIYTRVFMMSNHFDAYRLPHNDRRINVFDGPERLNTAEHYNALAQWIADDTAISQLFYWLMRLDLSGWESQRSLDTPARGRMIDYGRSATEAVFYEMLAKPPREIMTIKEITGYLDSRIEGDGTEPEIVNDKQVVKLLQEECSRYDRRRIAGERVYPWNLNPKKVHTKKEIRDILTTPLVDKEIAKVSHLKK